MDRASPGAIEWRACGKVEGFFSWGGWFLPEHPFPPRGEAGRSGLIPAGVLGG